MAPIYIWQAQFILSRHSVERELTFNSLGTQLAVPEINFYEDARQLRWVWLVNLPHANYANLAVFNCNTIMQFGSMK